MFSVTSIKLSNRSFFSLPSLDRIFTSRWWVYPFQLCLPCTLKLIQQPGNLQYTVVPLFNSLSAGTTTCSTSSVWHKVEKHEIQSRSDWMETKKYVLVTIECCCVKWSNEKNKHKLNWRALATHMPTTNSAIFTHGIYVQLLFTTNYTFPQCTSYFRCLFIVATVPWPFIHYPLLLPLPFGPLHTMMCSISHLLTCETSLTFKNECIFHFQSAARPWTVPR